MDGTRKDFCNKALLMLALAGAVMGVARAGYDVDQSDYSESNAMRSTHAQALLRTLSEEFTEVDALAAQQAQFRKMGNSRSTQIARMYGRWIREHKAGVPVLARLIRMHGANPENAMDLKKPVLGNTRTMLDSIHADHIAAVQGSQARFQMAKNDGDLAMADFMHQRANLARKHLREMEEFHDAMD